MGNYLSVWLKFNHRYSNLSARLVYSVICLSSVSNILVLPKVICMKNKILLYRYTFGVCIFIYKICLQIEMILTTCINLNACIKKLY